MKPFPNRKDSVYAKSIKFIVPSEWYDTIITRKKSLEKLHVCQRKVLWY